jgi:hypothetical protein
VQTEAMQQPENMKSIQLPGVKVSFHDGDGNTYPSLVNIADAYKGMPEPVKKETTGVSLADQEQEGNGDIPYQATPEDMMLTNFAGSILSGDSVRAGAVENYTSRKGWDTNSLSSSSFGPAHNSGEPSPTGKPTATIVEDFKKSLALYSKDKTAFASAYPLHYAAIKKIIEGQG